MRVLLNDEAIKILRNDDLPARLTVPQVAAVLGFLPHEIRVLAAKKMLRPFAPPLPNSPKFFAADEVCKLAGNITWLNEATQTIYNHWKAKKEDKGCRIAISI